MLILGDPSSVWEKEFVEHVLLPRGHRVFLQSNYSEDDRFTGFYEENGIAVIRGEPIPRWVMRMPKIRASIMAQKQSKALAKHGQFDIVINMFVSPAALSQALQCRGERGKVYAFFCGSDIIRSSFWRTLRLRSLLGKVDHVVCASSNVRQAYDTKIGNDASTPCTTIRLGITSFDYIDARLSNGTKNDAKQELNIPLDKITLSIGYNASGAQNHLPVLEQIRCLPQDVRDKLVILLPMTYGGNSRYISSVQKTVSQVGCEFLIFRNFMDGDQIARLRLATDIFINAQMSDGLSASVLEALYAGAILLNASWLSYREYLEWGLSLLSFSRFEDIPKLVTSVFSKAGKEESPSRAVLREKVSWNQCQEAWGRLLR